MMVEKKWIHVAVGVIQNACGDIFIAKRPQHVHQGGLWEFPGGKVESGESVVAALARELLEELGILVEASRPFIQIRHDYGDKAVLLDVHLVTQFANDPQGVEGQLTCWVSRKALSGFDFPAANRPIIDALLLPDCFAITGSARDANEWQEKLVALINKPELGVVVRTPLLHKIDSAMQLVSTLPATRAIQLNTSYAIFHQLQLAFPKHQLGLHCNRHELQYLQDKPVDFTQAMLGFSCHDAQELQWASALVERTKPNAAYVFLSPVLKTLSHPEAEGLGWGAFTQLTRTTNLPVYALGGVNASHLSQAWAVSARGVASISAFW